ncbi:hypothetical protein AJ80_03943 [Polytolypa hystricis UAMH7299]|uniref:Uncharacterized protein n=1 Tax=Polytolypa hystricis (strain UAMH7299) TaxID=1447883 RepID=A0A2B7YEY6_POLH7|nr:hypothetical protein AJ80_03943 [Polytolypa hystricis UAMH7299]
MTDHHDADHRTLNDSSILQFPILPLPAPQPPGEPQTGDSMMTSAAEADRPPSSLSESWATLSNSDIHSEDDCRSDHTDVASLVDQSVPDDVTSLGEPEDDSDVDTDVQSVGPGSQAPPLNGDHDLNSDSYLTASNLGSESIEFQEPDNWPDAELVELKHTIKVLDDSQPPEILQAIPHDIRDGPLTVNVQQTMAKNGLNLEKPFRVLYVGHHSAKQAILDKIGDVLVAGSDHTFGLSSGDPSRFHVVPASFGMGLNPECAELLPIHVQLVVDECVAATTKPIDDDPGAIALSFNNRDVCMSTLNTSCLGSRYELLSRSRWSLPDIAIIYISENDTLAARRTRKLAHTVMKRHGIPVMVISENPLWTKLDAMTPLDYQSLHICLESRDPTTGEAKVLGRYPIDMKTFESIAAGQLNRNLASLSRPSSNIASSLTSRDKRMSKAAAAVSDIDNFLISPIAQRFVGTFFANPEHARTFIASVFSIILLSFGYALIKFLMLVFLPAFGQIKGINPLSTSQQFYSGSETSFFAPRTVATTAKVESSLMPTPMSDIILSTCTDKQSLSVDSYLLGLSRPVVEKVNNSDRFQVESLGDCHIIIKVPASMISRRRPLKFNVKVTRSDEDLPHDLSKLFDGVYTVRLPREHAHGTLRVTITTKSKPSLEQVSEVDFGTPWLKIANWKKAAQSIQALLWKDLNAAQVGITEVYNRVSADAQTINGALLKEAEVAHRESFQRALSSTNSIVAKSRQLSEKFKRGAEKLTVSSKQLRNQARNELAELTNRALSAVHQHGAKLRQSAKVNFCPLTGKLEEIRKSQSLAMAQKRARALVQDAWKGRLKCSSRRHSQEKHR